VYVSANGYSLLGDGVCGGNNGYTSKDSFEACMELCKKTSECTAISWATSTNHCGLHEEAAPSAPLGGLWTEPYKCYLKGIICTDNNNSEYTISKLKKIYYETKFPE
jgi:hypothetical protein